MRLAEMTAYDEFITQLRKSTREAAEMVPSGTKTVIETTERDGKDVETAVYLMTPDGSRLVIRGTPRDATAKAKAIAAILG